MRRSTAPSFRRSPVFVSSISKREPDHVNSAQIISMAPCSAAPFPNAIRSTASVLSLLSGTRRAELEDELPNNAYAKDMIAVPSSGPAHTITQDTKARPAHLKDENFNGNQITPQCCKGNRLFNVVWGKQSKKKHKTWEGDGILEVGERTVVLKDMDGKIIGQCSGTKTATLEAGSRLFVGSKEVEIIDVASSGDIYDAHSDTSGNIGNKRLPESTSNASFPVLKKSRRTLPKSALFSVQRGRGPEKPLIMPSPTHEHQVQD